MPSSSLRFEMSTGYKIPLAVALGIALSILITVSAHHGYVPDPLGFLDNSLWDFRVEQANWFSHSVKAMALGVVICVFLIVFIRASGISSINLMESLTVVHRPAGKLTVPTAEVCVRKETLQPNGDYRITLQLGETTAKLRISSYHHQKLTELLSSAQQLRENIQLASRSSQPVDEGPNHQLEYSAPNAEADQRAHLILEQIEANPSPSSGYKNILFMLVSAFAFAVAGGFAWGASYTFLLVVGLFIHELGHVLAMRVFKYKNVKMLFLPFLGAVVTGEPRRRNVTKNAIISIAGPIFGTLGGIVSFVAYLFFRHDLLLQFSLLSFFLNAFNLLPFKPLDGGHFLNDVLFSRFPKAQLALDVIAGIGLAYLAFKFETIVLGIIAFLLLISAPHRFALAKLAVQLRKDDRLDGDELDARKVRVIREALCQSIPQLTEAKGEKSLATSVSNVWEESRKKHPRIWTAFALICAYIVLLFGVIPFCLGFILGFTNPTG